MKKHPAATTIQQTVTEVADMLAIALADIGSPSRLLPEELPGF